MCMYPKDLKPGSQEYIYTLNVHSSAIHSSEEVEGMKMPIDRGMTKALKSMFFLKIKKIDKFLAKEKKIEDSNN